MRAFLVLLVASLSCSPTSDAPGPGTDGPSANPPDAGSADRESQSEGGAVARDAATSVDSSLDSGRPDDIARCISVTPGLVGTYEITRVRLQEGAASPLDFTATGAVNSDGAVYSISGTIEAPAGRFNVRSMTYKNRVGFLNFTFEGTWSVVGGDVVALGYGDSAYKRSFATTVQGCVVALRMKPRMPGDGTLVLETEPLEIDLQRVQ